MKKYLLLLLFATSLNAQQHYPLIGWQTFSGAVVDYYARFDLIISRNYSESWIDAVRAINPNIILLHTWDWNTAQSPYMNNFPDEWWLKDYQGNYIYIYGGNTKMANLSTLCPTASASPYTGKRYVDYVATYLVDDLIGSAAMAKLDGLATDGVWGRSEMYWMWDDPEFAGVDINNNGVDDHAEMTLDQWLDYWQGGIDVLQQEIRNKIGYNKYLVVNSGNFHTWGRDQQNGIIDEKGDGFFNTKFDNDYYTEFKTLNVNPYKTVVDGIAYGANVGGIDSKNDWTGMRFGLVTSMFNDNYFSFQSTEASEHYWSHWYDEFELNLGQPTTGVYEFKPGLWAREFENGIAFANTDGTDKTLDSSELSQVYYYPVGNQNPSHNNGAQFTSYNFSGWITDGRYFGDGLILVTNPNTYIVSDIIIDNSNSATSPGQVSVILGTGTTQDSDCGKNAYYVRCSSWLNTYAYASSTSADQSEFKFTINVAGTYTLYEWHPADASFDNTVTMRLHDGTDHIIDQTINGGQWNKIGVYSLSTGTHSIFVYGEAGKTIAVDAIKWEFGETSTTPPPTAPPPPSNVTVEFVY